MVNHFEDQIHPIGTITLIHQKYASPKHMIMSDHGWKDCDGLYYNKRAYPLLFGAIGHRYTDVRFRNDEFQVPDLMSGKVELGAPVRLRPEQMPVHHHTINRLVNPSPHVHSWVPNYDAGLLNHNHGYFVGMDPSSKPIGHVSHFRQDDRGLVVNMKFDSSDYSKKIRELIDKDFTSKIVSAREMRASLGLQTDMDLFPDIATHGIKGMKWGVRSASSSITKENNMPTRTLKTPAENIERKDLTVALRLYGNARIQDELYDVIALVQSVGENESIYRASELKAEDVLGKNVRIHANDASGICSDFGPDDYSGKYNLVIAGKLEQLADGFIIVTDEDPEPLGEDTLRVVKD